MTPRALAGALMLPLLLACTESPALLDPSPPHEAGTSVTRPAIGTAVAAALDDALSRIVPTLGGDPAVVALQAGLKELRTGLLAGDEAAHRRSVRTAEAALNRLIRPELDNLAELEAVRLAIATSAVR